MISFKAKFSLGEKVVFFKRAHDTKKFLTAIPSTIKSIKFDKDGARFESDDWHGVLEQELTTFKNAPRRLAEELGDLTRDKK